jgi:pimeloyl-ACP methyl ester carboxylesterase
MNALTLLRAQNQVLGRLAPGWTARRAQHLFTSPHRASPRPWEQAVEASGQRGTLAVGWSYLRWGEEPESGRPGGLPPKGRVLCVHGWEGRATQFGRLADRLQQDGLSVLALDAPGHGRSPEVHAHPVSFARAVMDADRELGPFSAVIGHSMGAGAVALALSWGLRADRAVLLAPPSSIEGVLDRFVQFVGLPAEAAPLFRAGVEAQVGFPARDLEVSRLVSRVLQPGLIIHDPDDREVPVEDGRKVAELWVGARMVEMEGLGHRKMLGSERVMEEVRGFLREG